MTRDSMKKTQEAIESSQRLLQELPSHVTSETTRLLIKRSQIDLLDAIIENMEEALSYVEREFSQDRPYVFAYRQAICGQVSTLKSARSSLNTKEE